jgi:hypothetical protein
MAVDMMARCIAKRGYSRERIFITNLTPNTSGKNVSKTMNDYPDDNSVKSIVTDDASYRVNVIWDRGSANYCGQPNVCKKLVGNITNIAGCTFTGYADISLSDIVDNRIVAEYMNGSYSVDISSETAPTVQDITFGSLPINQISVKENDIIQITVTADKSFNKIIVEDFELAKGKTVTVTEGTSATISITCANRSSSTATSQRVKIKVVSPTGSTSISCISATGILLNNSVPNLVIGTKTYPTNQSALKNSESCIVEFTTTNADSITIASPNSELSIGTQTASNVVVTRISGDYNIATNNLSFTLKFNENQATNTVSTIVMLVKMF